MSYQVLARKWRPRIFREMVGQEHVLQALINALDHNRLHHAYLFTGTRGVGKTTIARILAKCLNCETGVSSEPCGTCSACCEIAEGRFVDLIEVDAASRTKVEDTRELLENVQYAPTRGRYKVYLIDEVHMLSNSSFNALLKTLEEPPPHVKFLLATTDPQKLPMTILSRCLQFNLKNMNPERIVNHLKYVLEQEVIPFEESALWLLGRAADGSMRDAMSLTDQAIAYGSGKVAESDVAAMLGTLDQTAVYEIVSALAATDGRAVLHAVQHMSEQAPDYANALAEMLTLLHRVAIAQALPEAVDNSQGDREKVMRLAVTMPAEDVQLFYQTALLGRRDLALAPDPRAGFEMVLLRMLAFKPQGVLELPSQPLPSSSRPIAPVLAAPTPSQSLTTSASPLSQAPAHVPAEAPPVASPIQVPIQPSPPAPQALQANVPSPVGYEDDSGPSDDSYAADDSYGTEDNYAPVDAYLDPADYAPANGTTSADTYVDKSADNYAEAEPPKKFEAPDESQAQLTADQPNSVSDSKPMQAVRKVPYSEAGPSTWLEIYLGLNVAGILQSTVANCQLVNRQNNVFQFVLDSNFSTLYDTGHQQRLADLLTDYFVETIRVEIVLGHVTAETPAMMAIRLRQERQAQAEAVIKSDPIVLQLINHFGATLKEDSIEPM